MNYIYGTFSLFTYRIKALQKEPYTQEEADRAAGMGSYKEPKKVAVETQSIKEDMDTEHLEADKT